MGTSTMYFIGLLPLALLMLGSVRGEYQCLGTDMKLNASQLADTKNCLAKAGVNSIWKIPTTDFPCFGRCMLKARGFLSDDGEHIVLDKVLHYIDVAVPPAAKKPLAELVTKCIKEHGDKVSEKNDEHCMTYLEVGQCVRDAFVETCVED